nr:MAG TPA: hypothetical protein [Inoviridae sp.]
MPTNPRMTAIAPSDSLPEKAYTRIVRQEMMPRTRLAMAEPSPGRVCLSTIRPPSVFIHCITIRYICQ